MYIISVSKHKHTPTRYMHAYIHKPTHRHILCFHFVWVSYTSSVRVVCKVSGPRLSTMDIQRYI